MKRKLAVIFSTAVLLAALTGNAHAFKFEFSFDAGADGLTVKFTRGILSGYSETIQLSRPGDPPQTIWLTPELFVVLSITSLDTNAQPTLTLHYVIWSGLVHKLDKEGDIILPYGHGFITNRYFYTPADPTITYDVQGATNIAFFRKSNYSLKFDLPELTSTKTAQVDPTTNEIHQTIKRDNDQDFTVINLVFKPRLLYNKVTFDITMTPLSATVPTNTFIFKGTIPVPYGSYHVRFYRDSKN